MAKYSDESGMDDDVSELGKRLDDAAKAIDDQLAALRAIAGDESAASSVRTLAIGELLEIQTALIDGMPDAINTLLCFAFGHSEDPDVTARSRERLKALGLAADDDFSKDNFDFVRDRIVQQLKAAGRWPDN